MCVHCLIKTLAKILGYCMLLLCMLCRLFAPSNISEGGGFPNGESASTSSEVDEDMEGRREAAVNLENSRQDSSDPIVSGGLTQCNGSRRFIECHLRDEYIDLHPEIPEEDISGISAKIAGGFPIQCQEAILESAVNLGNSRQDSSDPIVSGGLTQCNGGKRFIECHLRDEYIDLHPEIPEEDISGISAKIAGGFPIQCQEAILESAVNLENSRQDSSDPKVSGGLTQCNGGRRVIECHLRDEYIDLHPEIPIRSIQADQDQQNGEFRQQDDKPFQASLDNNMVRNSVQVTDDTSSSGSGVAELTELNIPDKIDLTCYGTESGHTPMHSHSPFHGGTEISEPVQDDYQGDSGGAPHTDEFVRSIRRGTLCIVCKKNTVEVKFETCGHAVCCFECASDMQQCNVCKKMILRKTSFFI